MVVAACVVLVGCADDQPSVVGPASQTTVSSPASTALSKTVEGPFTLQGSSLFSMEAKKDHVVIEDPKDYNMPCSATLAFSDKQNFVLTTTEWLDAIGGTPFRKIAFAGKMAPGGPLKFTWPWTWLEISDWDAMTLATHTDVLAQFRDHTGMEITGAGVNKNTMDYIGSFDGTRLVAGFHIEGFQRRIGTMGAPFDVMHDGPITVNFSLDLTVAK
jgi:hypothetical protein